MDVTCISDLHGFKPKLDGGDLLIVAGDLTAADRPKQHIEVRDWILEQDYQHTVVIAGNHDGYLVYNGEQLYKDCHYLLDSGCEIDYWEDCAPCRGKTHTSLKIWGSPWTPEFCGWHFMLPRGNPIKQKWDMIPDDIDILVTHGPPWGVLDKADRFYGDGYEHTGCHELLKAMERIKPKLHVFGHIHEGYGQLLYKHEGPNTICVNASIMNRRYEPENKPITIEL